MTWKLEEFLLAEGSSSLETTPIRLFCVSLFGSLSDSSLETGSFTSSYNTFIGGFALSNALFLALLTTILSEDHATYMRNDVSTSNLPSSISFIGGFVVVTSIPSGVHLTIFMSLGTTVSRTIKTSWTSVFRIPSSMVFAIRRLSAEFPSRCTVTFSSLEARSFDRFSSSAVRVHPNISKIFIG